MNDVGAMLIGMTRADIASFPQIGANKAGGTQESCFASMLEQYEESGERTVRASSYAKAGDPLLRLLNLIKKNDDEEDIDPQAELAALMNALIPRQDFPTEEIPSQDNDMEVNDALAFTAPEVQDELMGLFTRIAGEKESGVFLRILGKVFEDNGNDPLLPPMFRDAVTSGEPEKQADGLIQLLDRMIESVEAQNGDTATFVSLPSPEFDVEVLSYTAQEDSTPVFMTSLEPFLKDARARISTLIEDSKNSATQGLGDGVQGAGETGVDESLIDMFGLTPEISSAKDEENELADTLIEYFKPYESDHEKDELIDPVNVRFGPAEAPQASADTEFEPIVEKVSVTSLLDQIAESAALSRSEGVSKLELQLNPEFLGKVSIVLTSSQDGMTASLKSANETTRNILAENITALQETLKDMGINMKSIDVTPPEINWDFSRNPYSGQNGRSDPGHSSETGKNAFRTERMAGVADVLPKAAADIPITPSLQGSIYNSAGMYSADVSVDYRA